MRLSIIPLRLTRYSDSQNILTAYSRELGRVALTVPAGGGRAGARTRALLMPLGVIECEASRRPGRELLPLSQPRPLRVMASLHSHPVKQMLAMFVADVLAGVLREGPADPALWQYIASSAAVLDQLHQARLGNFHICFLIGLGRHLGIEPDGSTYAPGRILDLTGGVWRSTRPLEGVALDPAASAHAGLLMRITYANMHLYKYTRPQRAAVLEGVLQYYGQHLARLDSLKSLPVLKTLLH